MSTNTPTVNAGGRAVDDSHRLQAGHGLVLGLLMASTFIVLLNEMLLGVALPTLIEELGITATTGQWLTTGYLLTLAVLIPATGFVMRKFHLRTIYLTSMSVFLVGTVLAAIAPGFALLFAGRVLQAVGTAVFLPLLMATVMRLVPQARRGRMMAFVVVTIAAAPALGPAISGLVLSQLSWRWLFYLMVPVVLVGLALGAFKLRNVSTPEVVKLDVVSLVLAAIGFGALVYGLAMVGESLSGQVSVQPWIAIVIGAVGIAMFVLRQQRLSRHDAALLDMRIFAVKGFTMPLICMFVLNMTGFGAAVIIPLLLSDVAGLSSLEIGLFLVPSGITIAIVSSIGGRLYERVGPRPLAIPGSIIVASSLFFLSQVGVGTAVIVLLVAYIAMFTGQALMYTPLTTTALSALPAHLYPHGSAAFAAAQQLGGAAGAAILISAYTIGSGADNTGVLTLGQSVLATNAAFLAAGFIACISIVGTVFVRRMQHTSAAPVPTDTTTPVETVAG
jgi:DHA2 family lincomycin resistance protein-like MFS transporter